MDVKTPNRTIAEILPPDSWANRRRGCPHTGRAGGLRGGPGLFALAGDCRQDYAVLHGHSQSCTPRSTRVSRPETATARQSRIAHEAELIAQARASAAAGRTVSEEQVDAWIDSLNTDHEHPPPRSDG